jgi:hypothetical protein
VARRKRPVRGHHRTVPHEQATAALREDDPEVIQQRLFLLGHGKAQVGKQCGIVCSRRGEGGELRIPSELLAPLPGEQATPQAYWTCRQHHEHPVPDAELASGADQSGSLAPHVAQRSSVCAGALSRGRARGHLT